MQHSFPSRKHGGILNEQFSYRKNVTAVGPHGSILRN